MARAKRQSDEIYNARRRARRQAQRNARLIQSEGVTQTERQQMKAVNKELGTQIAKTYRKSAGTESAQWQAVSELTKTAASYGLQTSKLNEQAETIRQARNLSRSEAAQAARRETVFNETRRQQRKQKGDTDFRQQEKLFYRATQQYWQGMPADQRDKAIIEGMGVSTISEAWDEILQTDAAREALGAYRENRQALREGTMRDINEGWTDEMEDFYNSYMEEEQPEKGGGTPIFNLAAML